MQAWLVVTVALAAAAAAMEELTAAAAAALVPAATEERMGVAGVPTAELPEPEERMGETEVNLLPTPKKELFSTIFYII